MPELLVRGRLVRYVDVPADSDVVAALAAKQAAMLGGRSAYLRRSKRPADAVA